jgi:pimeloyl-ACP methyl ester carboxylesterase
MERDPTVYNSREYERFGILAFTQASFLVNGPSEFSSQSIRTQHLVLTRWTVIGPLKDETLVPAVEKIRNPILVVHGQYDELLYNQDEMIATLKGAKSIEHQQFPNSSHMPHYEDRKAYMVRSLAESVAFDEADSRPA